MTFDQETHPRIEFRNNPLKVVAAQITFPTLYGLTEPASLAAIQAVLGARYPTPLPRVPHFEITLGPAGADTQSAAGPIRFASEDGTWLINIATDWVSVETTAYVSWVAFRARFEELLAALPPDTRPVNVTRIGVRYVDQIQVAGAATPTDWRTYIESSLIGSADSIAFDDRILQALQQLSYSIDDNVINVRHGYIRNDPGSDFPSTYVIDTDLFTQTDLPFDPAAIFDRLNRYHDWAWSLFRRSITPATVELLGGSEE